MFNAVPAGSDHGCRDPGAGSYLAGDTFDCLAADGAGSFVAAAKSGEVGDKHARRGNRLKQADSRRRRLAVGSRRQQQHDETEPEDGSEKKHAMRSDLRSDLMIRARVIEQFGKKPVPAMGRI